MESVSYSLKQVEVLLETSKVLISVCTGYILIAVSGLKPLQERELLNSASVRRLLFCTFIFAIVCLGFWSGVLAFMVDCAQAFGLAPDSQFKLRVSLLNWEWTLGQACAQVALLSFFASVLSYCILMYKLLIKVVSK